jgi:vitamin B12 transporter
MHSLHSALYTLLLLFAVSAAVPLFAQEIDLNPVTITSSMVEKRASETGRNIAVIKGETFNKLPVHSLDELLRYIPGLEIQARGPMGSQGDIVLRGGTFQQVLVVLDGMRLNDPNTGHFSSYIPITPSEIERIEVLKGASSAIYGSEAVGGVIHIISKTFAARLQHQADSVDQTTWTTSLTGGNYGLYNINAGGFIQRQKITVSAGVLSNNADGVPQRGKRGFFHNNTVSASAQYALAPHWNMSIRSAFDNRDFAAQNFYTTFVSDTASEQVKSFFNQIKLTYQKGRSTLSLDGGYRFVNDTYAYNPSSVANSSKSQLAQGLLTWQHSISARTDFISGLNFQHKRIASNDRGDHHLNQLAPFVTVSHRIGEHLTLSPAIRLDWRETIGSELVPQVNVSYRKAQWQFRASAGKTIRDADFTERYNNYAKELVTGGNVGNPNLKAETSFSYEAGADWFVNPHLKISGTYFQRLQQDLIDYTSTAYSEMPRKDNLATNGTFALAKNIAKVNATGFEMDLQWNKPISARQQLYLNAGLTYLNSESSDIAPSFYISSHAKLLTNFSAIYRFNKFSVSLNGLYKSRKRNEATAIEATITKDYFLLNTKAEYVMIQNRLAVFAQIDNILNTQYSDLLGSKMPGIWTMGGVRYQWTKR